MSALIESQTERATPDASTPNPLLSILPLSPAFAGHQTFALRGGWLKKGFDALQNDGQIFTRPDALVTLGVGKNMVTAIRHWLIATRLARVENRVLAPTPLGAQLLSDDGFDPYLEDPASLWILHHQLCASGSETFTWTWAFNAWREWEWTRTQLCDGLEQAANAACLKAPSRETLERDASTFLQTYVASEEKTQNTEDGLDCPLRELQLIRRATPHTFRFAIGAKTSLPPQIFAWALGKFWNWKHPRAQTLSAREAVFAQGSPGQIFKLDEDAVLSYLDALETVTHGALRFEDTPLVRQVVLTKPLDFSSLLAEHFA